MITDQQRTDTMGAYGNHWIQSPWQDRLAGESFLFENAYCTQAVCTPARGSLMTGLYPHSHGCQVNYAAGFEALADIYQDPRDRVETRIDLPDDIPTLADMLPSSYRKGHFGKWHLGNDPWPRNGFDEWISTEDTCRELYTRPNPPFSAYHDWLIEHGFEPDLTLSNGDRIFSVNARAKLPPEFQMAAFIAGHSERYIREHRDRPWLLVFSTFEPHPPFTGPYNDLYDPGQLDVGPTFRKPPAGHSLWNRARADFFSGNTAAYQKAKDDGIVVEDLSDRDGWLKQRAQYFGNVKIIDDAVGRLMKVLEETGQSGNTLFAFTSDHGEMGGDHGMWEKRTFYEEAGRVPLLLRAPWLTREQRRIGGSFGHTDLVATLLDLAGQEVPSHLPGQSARAVLEDREEASTLSAVMEWNGHGDRDLGNHTINLMTSLPRRSLVSGDRWKLNLCVGDQGELFNLNDDPYEQQNLFDDPAQRDRVRRMTAELRLWQHRTADTAPLPSIP